MELQALQPVTIADRALFETYLRKDEQQTSELTFTNLFVWREHHGFRHTMLCDTLVVLACEAVRPFAFIPFGLRTSCAPEKVLAELKTLFVRNRLTPRLGRVDAAAMAWLDQAGVRFRAERDDGNDDYVYRTEDLVSLRGKHYDGKRNHIRRLLREHEVEYAQITEENLPLCEQVITAWFQQRSAQQTAPEWCACRELLKNYAALGCSGGLLLVDGIPEAVTFGELLNSDTAVIHFEKAVGHTDGAYPAINRSFVINQWSETAYINREQDLGIPGLRKAKQSYCPIRMVEKYSLDYS